MNLQVKFSEGTEAFNGKLDEDDLSVRAGFGETQNIGTTKHNELSNRNFADQHPITAITGLEEALAEKLPASDFVLGTTEGTAYEGSAGQKNADDIAFVKQVLIENGTISKIEVEQAYTSRVTASGENIVDGQKTPVTMIKGSTKRCENLLPYPYAYPSGHIAYSVEFTYDEQGVFTINGTATGGNAQFYLFNFSNTNLKSGTYTISILGGSSNTYNLEIERHSKETGTWVWGNPVYNTPKTFTLNEDEYLVVYMRVQAGYTANNQKIYVMLNEGSTALPWQPYFTGLKHAKIDSIVSTGRNLLNRAQRIDGIAATGQHIFAHERYSTFYFHAPFNTNVTLSCGNNSDKIYVSLSNSLEVGTLPVGNTAANRNKSVSINTQQYKYVLVSYWTADGNAKPDEVEIWANVGTTATEYTPFIQETYQLPETLELGEWDRFNPQTSEIVRGTGYATSETGFTEEEIATYDSAIVSLDGKTLEYKLATPTVEKLEYAPKSYTAYNQGNEAIVNENGEFGAIPTLTNEYFKLKES